MEAWHTKCPDKTPIRMPRPDSPYSPRQTTAKPRLLDQVRGVLRRKHYSIRTEQSYVDWIRRFILFNDKRHPAQMGNTPWHPVPRSMRSAGQDSEAISLGG